MKKLFLAFGIIILSATTYAQTSQPTLEQTVAWLKLKFIAYAKDGISRDVYETDNPHFGTENTYGNPCVIFEAKTVWNKPYFESNDVGLIMKETYKKSYLIATYPEYSWNKFTFEKKEQIRQNAHWEDPIISKQNTYFIPFFGIDRIEYNSGNGVMTLYATGNLITNQYSERTNSVEFYFNINGEQDIFNRLVKAIENIKKLTKLKEPF